MTTLLHMCVAHISFCCKCSHDGLLLTVGAEPGHHLGLVDAGLSQLDLLWMIGKERELSVVVVFFGGSGLHQLPQSSAFWTQPRAFCCLWASASRLLARSGLLVPTDHLCSRHFGAPRWLAHTCCNIPGFCVAKI